MATEVALHCMICYEEFDLKDRHPVVLPCGHTYVCIVCAKRLKKCMECREPLFWNPPRQHNNHVPTLSSNTGRSPAHPRYAASSRGRMGVGRYSPGAATPQTPPHPGAGVAGGGPPEKKEELPLPLPKNVVLMEMIEAKERQVRLLEEARRREQEELLQREQEKQLQQMQEQLEKSPGAHTAPTTTNLIDAEAEEDEFLLDPTLAGMAAFSGACGTYVVREPLGLVVLPQDPNRRHQQTISSSSLSFEEAAGDYRDDDNEKENGDEKKEQLPVDQSHRCTHFTASSSMDKDDLSYSNSNITGAGGVRRRPSREPFSVEEGQRVQVVGVDEGVYQLARGAGYIVATVNQLVKVGAPLETSCKLEGMLQSVARKQLEVERQLAEINKLARGLQEKIELEQSHPEDHPVITPPKNTTIIDGQLIATKDGNLATVKDDSQPSTPTKNFKCPNSSPAAASIGGHSTRSNDSTAVELGAPITPGQPNSSSGPFLEMEHGSGSASYPYEQQYVHSPAHSCPMLTANAVLDQPFIDGTPAGLPRYRVNSDDDMYGLGWAGALGCGSSLFGERLLEPPTHGARNILTATGNDILALSFDEHSLLDNARTRSQAAALSASVGGVNGGSQDSPLRSGGSFDGVNFRTGMSGHRGLSQPKRDRANNHTGLLHASSAAQPRRQIRMMSEHRGVAAVRGGTGSLKRRTTPDALVGCQEF